MTEFDKLNLRVVPIQDPVRFNKFPNYGGKKIMWSDPSTYCSWEERELVYPDCNDWYVIPASRCVYSCDGVEVCYYVLDVDNHEPEGFKAACEFLRSCNLPPSLTIRTPSGGIHRYYKCLADCVPKAVNGIAYKGIKLPIEIKSSVGVVAPNGRDRVIIDDRPVAVLMPEANTLFSYIATLKPNVDYPPPLPEDPNFDLSAYPYPDATPGERHDLLRTNITSMLSKGCPKSLALEWGVGFYNHVGRKPQPKEIENVVEYAYRYLSNDAQAVEREIIQMKQEAEDPLAGATPLPPLESLYASALFSTPKEIYQLVNDTLSSLTLTPEEEDFAAALYTTDLTEMQAAWSRYPHLQAKFVYLKDTLKLAIEYAL